MRLSIGFVAELQRGGDRLHVSLKSFAPGEQKVRIMESSTGGTYFVGMEVSTIETNRDRDLFRSRYRISGKTETENGQINSVISLGQEKIYCLIFGLDQYSTAVFFNLGSAEPRGSAKIFLSSTKYLTISSFAFIYSADHLKE